MLNNLLGLCFLALFIAVPSVYAYKRTYFDRYHGSLYDMPLWWMRQQKYGRRRA